MFPSPQVGSELVVRETFAPFFNVSIPSSRVGTGTMLLIATPADCFHPLKSGRNRSDNPDNTFGDQVSIPSSRVGTRERIGARRRERKVSIPSSRVGTRQRSRKLCRQSWFPSPQVGSGPAALTVALQTPTSFHPLKSGRDDHFRGASVICRRSFHPLKSGRDFPCGGCVLWNADVSIPSSRVGTWR